MDQDLRIIHRTVSFHSIPHAQYYNITLTLDRRTSQSVLPLLLISPHVAETHNMSTESLAISYKYTPVSNADLLFYSHHFSSYFTLQYFFHSLKSVTA